MNAACCALPQLSEFSARAFLQRVPQDAAAMAVLVHSTTTKLYLLLYINFCQVSWAHGVNGPPHMQQQPVASNEPLTTHAGNAQGGLRNSPRTMHACVLHATPSPPCMPPPATIRPSTGFLTNTPPPSTHTRKQCPQYKTPVVNEAPMQGGAPSHLVTLQLCRVCSRHCMVANGAHQRMALLPGASGEPPAAHQTHHKQRPRSMGTEAGSLVSAAPSPALSSAQCA
mmetsp:Transcript_24179/g.61501  ORF Transcript_24179/g.61501 Transcript_24179/m.61501 type:complete len:226 (+) Transcript_24179:710-1387(+)